jgi:hypothetical protein
MSKSSHSRSISLKVLADPTEKAKRATIDGKPTANQQAQAYDLIYPHRKWRRAGNKLRVLVR